MFNHNFSTLRVLITLPRSGTHWLKKLISYVMGCEPLERRLLESANLIEALNNEASQRLCYDHFDFELHGSVLDPNSYSNLRLVLLYRDPRDALISNFYRRSHMDLLPAPNLGVIDNLRLFLRDSFIENPHIADKVKESRLFSMTYRDYIRRCVIDWLKFRPVFAIRYEDLVSEPDQYLSLVLDHLNVRYSSKAVAEAILQNSFQVLSGGRFRGMINVNSHYRRGVPGEWRQIFTSEDLKILNKKIGDYIEFLGYPLK